MKRKTLYTFAAGLAAVAIFASAAAAGTTTVRVDGEGVGDWQFNPDADNATPYEFSLDQASIGYGSLYVDPISSTEGARKFIAAKVIDVDAVTFDAFSYDFLIAGNGDASDANEFYLNVYVNLGGGLDPNDYYDCRFDFVPTTGSTAAFTSFAVNDTTTATTVAPRGTDGSTIGCPNALADLPLGSTVDFVTLNVGDTSLNDADLAGYFDNVSIEIGGDITVYDFEVPLTVKDACKNGGYVTYGFDNQGDCVSSLQANDHAGK